MGRISGLDVAAPVGVDLDLMKGSVRTIVLSGGGGSAGPPSRDRMAIFEHVRGRFPSPALASASWTLPWCVSVAPAD